MGSRQRRASAEMSRNQSRALDTLWHSVGSKAMGTDLKTMGNAGCGACATTWFCKRLT
jgi:uncharacterized protein YidB (DUF937 family)